MDDNGKKIIARNRKAFHEFEMLDFFDAGLVLQGTEIKAVRDGNVSFRDSYIELRRGEAWLVGFYIAPYDHGNRWNHKDDRPRKLLLNKREIYKLDQKTKERGFTIVPIELFLSRGKAKLSIALARGKATYDKRASIKKRETERDIQRIKDRYS